MRSLSFLPLAAGLSLAIAACSSTIDVGGTGGSSAATGTSTTGNATGTGTTGAGGGAPCPDPPAPQAFEIGTGEACFERLTPMQTVKVLQGPQGGYHLWLAVGCADCGAKATLAYGVKDPATHDWIKGTGELKQVVDLSAGGWPQRAGIIDFLPGIVWDPMTSLPKGTHVLLVASVLDEAMKPKHAGEVEVVLGDVEMWAPPCDPGPYCGAPGGLPCCTDGTK